MIIVKSDDKFVMAKVPAVLGYDWTDRLGLACRFEDEASAKRALRTLGWHSRMKDIDVRFLRVSEAGAR